MRAAPARAIATVRARLDGSHQLTDWAWEALPR